MNEAELVMKNQADQSSCCFLLFFLLLFRLVPAVVLTIETSEVSAIFVFTTKTTQPRPHKGTVP